MLSKYKCLQKFGQVCCIHEPSNRKIFNTYCTSLSLHFVRRMNKPRKSKETNSKGDTDSEIDEFNDNDFDEDDMDQEGVYSNQKGTLNMH